jgi:superfamily I DNA and/or RNA helicase
MSCARHVVVVGDQRQLPPIPVDAADGLTPPVPAYDCQRNLLAALAELHGDSLPRTLLREHHRCDPVIIGFCNKKFYDGDLIPYTSSGPRQAMIVHRTAEGSHMRHHRGGARSNRREIDVIEQEVIPQHCPDFPRSEIGVTSPYRLQASKAADVLDQAEAGTVCSRVGKSRW